MTISEHDNATDLNDRRMNIQLVGTLPSDDGDLDVDARFEWAKGCP